MAKYAVIKLQGHQYKITEGQEILVDKLGTDKVEPQVLLAVDDDKVSIGKPFLAGAKIKIKILAEEEKGEKIRVVKYKSKSRYRKTKGFRPVYSRLLIEKITAK